MRLRDLRGLGHDDREKVRRGFNLDVGGDGKVVQCCGKLMVYDTERRRHFCQECLATDPPIEDVAHHIDIEVERWRRR